MRYVFCFILIVFMTLGCEGISYQQVGSHSQNNANNSNNNSNNNNNANNTNNQTNPDVDDDGDGFSENQGDCNDLNAQVYPGRTELCNNGIDDNCNKTVDRQEPDGDGDGYGPCGGDCNDENPEINPSHTEIPDNGIDDNCDGFVDADYDGDGYTVADGDCDDGNPAIHPGVREDCFDGVDNDCNGYTDGDEPDKDGDAYGPCNGDCNDENAQVYPGAQEIAGDGVDNNCDYMIDMDVDNDGWTVANGDCDDLNAARNPGVLEVCNNGIDDDCDGTVDSDCLTPCQLAEMTRSSVGCVYYAVDANNDPYEGYDALQYAVGISNTHPTLSANVQILAKNGGVWQTVNTQTVGPRTLAQINLPDRHINYTGMLTGGAYKIVSDLPVIAYQFQPVDGVNSYTSDASLLLPTSSLDRFYYVLNWGLGYGNPQLVVAAVEDNTTFTITSAVNTTAGGSIPALSAGVPWTSPTLNEGDFIQIESPSDSGFNGTYITSNKPIAVFSNNWCANVPTQNCCCDHLEEQLIGLQSWGRTYVASRMPVRSSGTPDINVWQVLASQNNTTVTFTANPQVTGLPAGPITLNAGQMHQMTVTGTMANPGDFIVSADKPILVMGYLTTSSSTNAPVAQAGDPAMTQMVPVEQFLDNYIVLVPINWIYDYAVLTKRVGSTVYMNGVAVPQSAFIPIDAQWEVGRISVPDGVHAFTGTSPFGIVIVGYDSYDSYAYPGGLNMQIINPMN